MLSRVFTLAVFACLCAASVGRAATCAAPVQPGRFHFMAAAAPAPGMAVENGVEPPGFVAMASGKAAVHGIDVSKYQDETDFEAAYACGARFAYITLSSGTEASDHSYRAYWPNARAAGLWAGPMHSLQPQTSAAQSWFFAAPAAKAALFADLLADAPRAGAAQANLFLARLDEVLSSEVTPKGGDVVRYPPIALDLTADPLSTASAAEKAQFGQVYAATACAFIDKVHANPKTRNAKIILMTSPDVYAAYDLSDSACGLAKLPVWIAYATSDGDSYDGASAAADRAAILALCHPPGGSDRCVMHQYSTAASFAIFQTGGRMHLDRFDGSEAELRAALQVYR